MRTLIHVVPITEQVFATQVCPLFCISRTHSSFLTWSGTFFALQKHSKLQPHSGVLLYGGLIKTIVVSITEQVFASQVCPVTGIHCLFVCLFVSSSKVSIPGYGGAAMPVCWLPAWYMCGSGSTIVSGLNKSVGSSVRYNPRMSSSWVPSASLLSSSEGRLGPLLASVVILLLPVPHVIAGHVPLVK